MKDKFIGESDELNAHQGQKRAIINIKRQIQQRGRSTKGIHGPEKSFDAYRRQILIESEANQSNIKDRKELGCIQKANSIESKTNQSHVKCRKEH